LTDTLFFDSSSLKQEKTAHTVNPLKFFKEFSKTSFEAPPLTRKAGFRFAPTREALPSGRTCGECVAGAVHILWSET